MIVWDQFVDLFRVLIISYAQACGGNLGAGILTLSVVVRIVMFPITLRIARATRAHQQAMKKLQPELERIRKRYRKQPQRIAEESQKLFQENGVSPIPCTSCLGGLAQTPLYIAIYSAVRRVAAAGGRFLWIGNIARPDLLLAIAVAALTYASISHSTADLSQQGRPALLLLPVLATFFVLAWTSAGVALYWGVSAAASLTQSVLIERQANVGVEHQE